MILSETELGLEISDEKFIAFFGNKKATLELVKLKYPKLTFQTLHQTHSDKYLEVKEFIHIEPMVDAALTQNINLALVIKTADCMPILVFDQEQYKIAAIHAGWRGVENRILCKVLEDKFYNKKTKILIGPHILWDSFEVECDVKERLIKEVPPQLFELISKKSIENKYFINLFEIVKYQVEKIGYSMDHIYAYLKNTVADTSLNSYRRDRQNSGRNLSFIALK